MHVIPAALENLIDNLAKLPGIGKKTATRLALNILRNPPSLAAELAFSLKNLHQSIQICSTCFTFSENDPCRICSDPKRNSSLICVVEQSGDLLAIEKTDIFRGQYHILQGVISPIDGIGPSELKIKELIKRIRSSDIKEVLIATSSTVPGEATASYLIDQIHHLNVRVTRLACGIPMGMDIKYADKHTLAKAIETRGAAE